MASIQEQYRKANRVIDSCDNHTQLKAAKRYINLFFRMNAKLLKKSNYWVPDSPLVTAMYDKLEMRLWAKTKKLKQHIR